MKTRLIPVLGKDGAAALHATLIKHTLAMAKASGLGPVELHGAPADDDFLRSCALHYGAALVAQCEGDLGARMHAALVGALADASHVLLIGSDCPALTMHHLQRAADALAAGHDAAFIPAEDGGYALIGAKQTDPVLFADIAWSTAKVMAQTRTRLRKLGWRWAELDTVWDVDRPEDCSRLLESKLLEPQVIA